MLIKFSSQSELSVEGGIKFLDVNEIVVHTFPSPIHPGNRELKGKVTSFGDIKILAEFFPNHSVLLYNKKNGTLYFSREYPGNRMIYYVMQREQNSSKIFISDSITILAKEITNFNLSDEGVKLFLQDRKHFQLKTAFENINLLLPGFFIQWNVEKFHLSIEPWYSAIQPITVNTVQDAVDGYRKSIDKSILNCIDARLPIALMFSGGSDSALLLERMLMMNLDKIELFNVKVKGQETEYDRAVRCAQLFCKQVNLIEIEPSLAIDQWSELLGESYLCASDSRIDGMFAASPQIYQRLKDFYKGQAVNVMWGLQHSFAAPGMKVSTILKFYLLYYFFFATSMSNISFIKKNILKRMMRITNLNYENSPAESIVGLYQFVLHYFNKISHADQLLNFKILFSNARKKEFSIERQKFPKEKYYPNAINVFPFYDSEHQEDILKYSFSARVGGVSGIFKSPKSYKHLTLRAFDKMESEFVIGGTRAALPAWWSFFNNEKFISLILELKSHKFIGENVNGKRLDQITSEKEFINKLTTEEIEKFTALFSLKRIEDNLNKFFTN